MAGPTFSRDVGEMPGADAQTPDAAVPAPVAEASGAVAELITARARRWVYALYALGSVVLGAIQVGYSAGGFAHPVWLTIATAVWVFLGGSQGLLALLKTPPE
ncbi:hypothetical protein [Rothia nasimurium]|uniref:hypothetical protein n=1 Tax=Rothia nasimurium TaxID=85336 RepID=UPI001F40D9E9|nr:hypothetical protein [Rothia nasimurium]